MVEKYFRYFSGDGLKNYNNTDTRYRIGEKCHRYFSGIRPRIYNNIDTGYRVGKK